MQVQSGAVFPTVLSSTKDQRQGFGMIGCAYYVKIILHCLLQMLLLQLSLSTRPPTPCDDLSNRL
jgi:hypothetical protein